MTNKALRYPIAFFGFILYAFFSPCELTAELLKVYPGVNQEDAKPALYPEWWGLPELPATIKCRNSGSCMSCHEEHGTMDASHAFECTKCHKGNSETTDKNEAHSGLIKNPGDLRTVETTCGSCHPAEASKVKISPMALNTRMIGHVRYAFGSQLSPEPSYGTSEIGNIKLTPELSESKSLGDDLLRRSCLRCHLNTTGSDRIGEKRNSGCSACHVPYSNRNTSRHMIVKDLGITPCIKCHNSNHVGADYVGLFEKDYERGFRSPFRKGRQAETIYGSEQHRLIGDVHFRAGMKCTDCHLVSEIHGSGEEPQSQYPGVTISCESCHMHGNHPAVLTDEKNEFVLLKQIQRRIPKYSDAIIPHSVENHKAKVKCSSCHAAWSFQDYGLHLMLEERADYWKWSITASQNDPQIQKLLQRNIGSYAELIEPKNGPIEQLPEEKWDSPNMFDWLTGEVRAGAWFRGYTERNWSRPPLGLDHKGKVAVLRPMFQYAVSHVGVDSALIIDREIPISGSGAKSLIVNPYAPHTISAKGRLCHDCHGNPKSLGLGEGRFSLEKKEFLPIWKPELQIPGHSFIWSAFVSTSGEPLQISSRTGAGPLDRDTLHKLMTPSDKFKSLFHKHLTFRNLLPQEESKPEH